ncbi:MAG: aldehyde dehydrogenase family protein [Bacteroides sp.]|nr:aldehyde dehydrogenase family protein [Ruminococcus flavefaciens]MCM1555616.1 aldehyde dehydrogenase family protein [Bacteroides sp.]
MEIKEMVAKAREAQAIYERTFNQSSCDAVVRATARVIFDNAEMLAKMAVEETKMGKLEDKIAKCRNKSKGIWYNLRDKKSMGILEIDERTDMITIAKPIGVVAGITPMTNPVVTPMSKIMFALKTKNAIIIAPHPKSKLCSAKAVHLIQEKIQAMGVPQNLVQIIEEPSIESTQELMKAADVVVATGGMPMVKSAYSSGKPSFGVGAGNVQCILDTDINFEEAAKKVVFGRTFDNGIICSGEQFFCYPKKDKEAVFAAFKKAGAYFCNDEEKKSLLATLFKDNAMNRDVVGQDIEKIAAMAGIKIPAGTKTIVAEAIGAAQADQICKEKMCPVMGCIGYDNFEEGLRIMLDNLHMEGNGHTCVVHSNNQGNILMAGHMLTVSRVVVNAPGSTTGGGAIQNGLAVTNTLGCGTWGNNSISENFTYKHLLNTTRIAPLCERIRIPSDEEMWG